MFAARKAHAHTRKDSVRKRASGESGACARCPREAIWSRYVDEITDEAVDVVALVAASELFTPADIEFSARKAAQAAFEREHFGGADSRATTDDFLAAIRATKPSLTSEIIADFEDDTQRFTRD